MISGLDPKRHGVTWNGSDPDRGSIRVPTIFTWVRDAGGRTGMWAAKKKFRHLFVPADIEVYDNPGYGAGRA